MKTSLEKWFKYRIFWFFYF